MILTLYTQRAFILIINIFIYCAVVVYSDVICIKVRVKVVFLHS